MRTETPSGTASGAGAKFRIERTPAPTIASATACAAAAGVQMTPISASCSRAIAGRSSTGRIASSPIRSPTFAGSASTSAGGPEPPLGEPPVVGERVPEVADPDDHDRPVLREPELAADLMEQVRDVVPHPSGPVRPEVGQVLADLRRVDAGRLGERVGGDRGDAGLGELDQRPEVDRQPPDGGLRDGAVGHATR